MEKREPVKKSWRNSSRIWYDTKNTLARSGNTLVVFDLETTGLSRVNDRIIELGAIRFNFDDAMNLMEEDFLHTYINPERLISPEITELTGITNERLAGMPTEAQVFDDIQDFFENSVISGYNIDAFDVKFMENLYGRMGAVFSPMGTIDGIKIARDRLDKGVDVENHKLSSIAGFFGIDFTAHSAIEDTRATAKVVQLLIKEYIQNELDENKPKENGTIRPVIKSVKFWAGFKGFSRIYVNTSAGNIYYDIRSQRWGGDGIDTIDMVWLEAEVWELTESVDEKSFASFNGSLEFERAVV